MATETKIARVAFMDRGVYSGVTEYSKWDFVTTEDSTYLYIGETPATGKPVTDIAYWKCIADGKQATLAAAAAAQAAGTANDAASLADQARLAIETELGEKAAHGYDVEETPKTLKEVDDEVSQLAGEVSLLDAVQSDKIKDIENVISTMNPNQSAQLSVSGVSPLSLPKNAANSGMSVKMEGLTQDVGGVITHFEPTGRVRSVDKNGLNPTALYLTAPELRSNDTVKDEIRKGANGYEVVKRVGVGTLGAEVIANEADRLFTSDTGFWIKGGTTSISDGVAHINASNVNALSKHSLLLASKWYKLTFEVKNYVSGSIGFASFISPKYRNANGVYELYGKTNTSYTSAVLYATSGTVLDIDNISIKEVTASEAIAADSALTELSDGSVLYTLATPVISPISYGGILNSAENGTIYHEHVIADAGVYGTNLPIFNPDYPIASIEEIIKHEGGVDTYLNASTAVIAPDGLRFTHPDLASGDLVLFTYSFDKESTNGNITATFYDSNVVKIDTVTGKAYKITDVVTNGVLTRTLTEV